ncbi:MAG: hypothetical protein ACI4FY_11425 [Acetatifactor sp.]
MLNVLIREPDVCSKYALHEGDILLCDTVFIFLAERWWFYYEE